MILLPFLIQNFVNQKFEQLGIKMQDKFLTKLGSVIELILEQYGFEQHVSTYMQIFSINTTVLHSPRLVESMGAEPLV